MKIYRLIILGVAGGIYWNGNIAIFVDAQNENISIRLFVDIGNIFLWTCIFIHIMMHLPMTSVNQQKINGSY